MRIAIIGANGQLGSDLRTRLPGEVIALDVPVIDVCDEVSVRSVLSEARPDLVINCAAATHVDNCEQQADLAHAVNALGARNVAQQAAALAVPDAEQAADQARADVEQVRRDAVAAVEAEARRRAEALQHEADKLAGALEQIKTLEIHLVDSANAAVGGLLDEYGRPVAVSVPAVRWPQSLADQRHGLAVAGQRDLAASGLSPREYAQRFGVGGRDGAFPSAGAPQS